MNLYTSRISQKQILIHRIFRVLTTDKSQIIIINDCEQEKKQEKHDRWPDAVEEPGYLSIPILSTIVNSYSSRTSRI